MLLAFASQNPPLFPVGIRKPSSMAVSPSINPGLHRIPLSILMMSLLIARTFLIALMKGLFHDPSVEHSQVMGLLVLQNKSVLIFHLPNSFVPFLTMMLRCPDITTSFTAGHYCDKTSKSHPRVYESKIQESRHLC